MQLQIFPGNIIAASPARHTTLEVLAMLTQLSINNIQRLEKIEGTRSSHARGDLLAGILG